jgi:hypothetical protein
VDILPTSLTDLDLTPLKRFSHNVIANIRATGHMLIGSKRAFYWVKPTVWQFLLFGLTALASNLLFSWLVAEDATYFKFIFHLFLISLIPGAASYLRFLP